MSINDRRHRVGKLLLLALGFGAALALGRCWGQHDAPASQTGAEPPRDAGPTVSSAAAPAVTATTTATQAPTVVLKLDASNLRLLPDASIQLQPIPPLDPDALYRNDDHAAARRGRH
ncbi:MAG TPA: hypothetical protein ENK23_02920 [Sorangium sp.]|nr:hypothetical protein [Sorangium sp.]